MFSLDFEEFLWAKGYTSTQIDDMLQSMLDLKPFSKLQHTVFTSLFLDYCILGGMPEVVKQYIKNNTFEGTLEIQRQLIADYKEDIRKYAESLDRARIMNVFNSIPFQLSKENKNFSFQKYKRGHDLKTTAVVLNG